MWVPTYFASDCLFLNILLMINENVYIFVRRAIFD